MSNNNYYAHVSPAAPSAPPMDGEAYPVAPQAQTMDAVNVNNYPQPLPGQAVQVVVGQPGWAGSLCDCCGQCWPSCLCALVLPCFPLAALAKRLNVASYGLVLGVLALLYVVQMATGVTYYMRFQENVANGVYNLTTSHCVFNGVDCQVGCISVFGNADCSSNGNGTMTIGGGNGTSQIIINNGGGNKMDGVLNNSTSTSTKLEKLQNDTLLWSVPGYVYHFVVFLLVLVLLTRVRKRYSLPSPCCGCRGQNCCSLCGDILASYCCTWCVVVQMSRQVFGYKDCCDCSASPFIHV